MAMIAPIIKMDRIVIETTLIILNFGRAETLRFFLLNFVVNVLAYGKLKQDSLF
jgi:hypothetical protein